MNQLYIYPHISSLLRLPCLCILDINPFLVISFANIFFHSLGHLFVLSMVFFPVQKLLSLIQPHLFIFAFISFALGDRFKKYCYDLCQRLFCLCSPLGVSGFQVWFWYHILHLHVYSFTIVVIDALQFFL